MLHRNRKKLLIFASSFLIISLIFSYIYINISSVIDKDNLNTNISNQDIFEENKEGEVKSEINIAYISKGGLNRENIENALKSFKIEEDVIREDTNTQSVMIDNDSDKNNNEEEKEEEEIIIPEPEKPSSSCPISTLNCVPCHKSETYCRYEEGQEYGYLGWACQNNNPSNIRYSDYRINIITVMNGPAPCGEKGGFMVFTTYESGREGVKAYLKGISAGLHSSYHFCGDGECSLREFFSKYAPNSDGNDPNGYAQYMATTLGVSVDDTPLSWIVENKLEEMVNAIQHKEGFFTKEGQL
jgi:hypothetical protein